MKTWLVIERAPTELIIKWLLVGFIFYSFLFLSLTFLVRWVKLTINHPLAQFLSFEAKVHPEVQIELENYNRWLKFSLVHGLSATTAWLGFFVYYQNQFPAYIEASPYRLYYALRQSLYLQIDKYNYLQNLTTIEIHNGQHEIIVYTNDLLIETQKLLTEVYSDQIMQAQTDYYKLIFSLFLTFFLVIVCLILVRKFFTQSLAPHAIIIPSVKGLPGLLILKLLYPLVFLILISLGLYYWKKSRLSFTEFVGRKILTDQSCSNSVVRQLKLYRYYIVGSVVSGNIILIVNWLVFAASFVSYRFSNLGIENLLRFKNDLLIVKQLLINQNEKEEKIQWVDQMGQFYTHLINQLQTLEELISPQYSYQIDPVRRTLVVTFNSFIVWFVFIVYGWGSLLFNSTTRTTLKNFKGDVV